MDERTVNVPKLCDLGMNMKQCRIRLLNMS